MTVPQLSIVDQINASHDRAMGHVEAAWKEFVNCGELLIRQKALLEHGEWIPWMKANLRFSPRWAQTHMQAAENKEALALEMANTNSGSHLSIKGALARITAAVIKPHPLADLFPPIEGIEFDQLVGSIRVIGLSRPITLYQGKILDGVQRYRACIEADVPPRYEEFEGDEDDAMKFVIQQNILRCHLRPAQRAEIAAKLSELKAEGNT